MEKKFEKPDTAVSSVIVLTNSFFHSAMATLSIRR